MADRRPIVIGSGNVFSELPSGDTISWNWLSSVPANITSWAAIAPSAKFNTPSGSTSQYIRGDGSLATFPTIPSGTVTSVDLSMPSTFNVSGNPVTGSGTLTVIWSSQPANYVMAGPTNGSPTTPAFRQLVLADIPTLSSLYLPVTGGNVSGAVVGVRSAQANNTSEIILSAYSNNVNGEASIQYRRGAASNLGGWDFYRGNAAASNTLALRLNPDGTSSVTSIAASGTVSDSLGNVRDVLPLTVSSSRNLAQTDRGQNLIKTGNTAYTVTIQPNATVAVTTGTTVTFTNLGGSTNNLTIARGSGVALYRAGTNADIVLTPGSTVTLTKVDTNNWQG